MPTLEELLNASNEVATCTVNPDTREIIVPEKYKILGVFSDEKVTKIPFTCPKVVGNNVNLTEYNLYINYQNAIGRHNAYLVDDVAVSGDNITFSWLLSRDVTLSSGVVKYSICAKKLNGDSISNEWNTTIANGVVIQGLEATQAIVEENSDIIEAILSKAHTHANKSVLDKFAETDGKPTYDGKDLGGGASTSEGVSYTNAQLPNAANVKTALDELVPKSHSHANKDVLDKLSVSNGKLQYNGSNVGLKGDKGTNGTTPHIGDNGNWYLGTTDTGKPSRGAKGNPGKNGSDASVTEANITSALGYKPVAPGDIPVVPTADISANTSARHSHTNKDVLDSITAVDTAMSDTSTNPVQNKVIKKYIDDHSSGTGGTGGTANAVLYTAQTLDLAQQGQARTNIGAIGYNSPQFQGFLSLAPANAPLGTGVGLSPSGSGNDFTLDISDVNEGTPTLLTGVKTPTDADTNAAATVEYVKSKVAGSSGGSGSSNAVLYTEQSLTFEQKMQARKNIEAADSVAPTITGTVSLCPDNITDSNDAVHVTARRTSAEDYTVIFDGGPENALVGVRGIRTPTDSDTNAAATVEYVKTKIASSGGGGSGSSNILTSPVMICKPGEEGSAGIYLSTIDTGEKQAEIKFEDANENSAVAIANLRTPTGANASDYAATKGYVDSKVPTALKNPNALTIKIGSTTVTYDGSAAQTVTIDDGTEVSY